MACFGWAAPPSSLEAFDNQSFDSAYATMLPCWHAGTVSPQSKELHMAMLASM